MVVVRVAGSIGTENVACTLELRAAYDAPSAGAVAVTTGGGGWSSVVKLHETGPLIGVWSAARIVEASVAV